MTSPMTSPKELIKPTSLKFDLPLALEALRDVTSRHTLSDEFRQINMVHTNKNMNSVYDGTGTLFDFDTNTWKQHESEFSYFAEEFKSTYFFEIFNRLSEHLGETLGRTRLMHLSPKACYSMHRDPTVRYHLPLITNDQAFIIFREGHIFQLPAVGDLFLVDTRHHHTAMNGGNSPRIHLVLNKKD